MKSGKGILNISRMPFFVWCDVVIAGNWQCPNLCEYCKLPQPCHSERVPLKRDEVKNLSKFYDIDPSPAKERRDQDDMTLTKLGHCPKIHHQEFSAEFII